MGKLIRSSALVLLLAFQASAGVMMPGVAEPPPPTPQQSGTMQNGEPAPQTAGIMINGSPQAQSAQEMLAQDAAATPLLVQVALNLLTLL
jgi:hypothetical protein